MNYKIVTPVIAEPVTLSEAKSHIRQMAETFASDVSTYQSIKPAAHSVGVVTGAAVDVLGKQAIVNLNAGAIGASGSIAAKIQESDDNTNWRDFASFVTVNAENQNTVQETEYTGGKQYIRAVATVADAACSFSADIVIKSGEMLEDSDILGYISAAREYCEEITRRALATQTIELYLDYFPAEIKLPRPPLQSVDFVKYKDSAGAETTLVENADYIVDTDSDIGRIVLPYGKSWPSFAAWPVNPIKVRYTAGYETDIPKTIKQAILLLVGYWYENRETVIVGVGTISKEAEFAVAQLLALHKAGWF